MDQYLRHPGININFPFSLIMPAVIWGRVLSVVSVVPFLFGKPVPRMVRVGVSMLLAVFLYPILVTSTSSQPDIDTMKMFALFLKEILFGLAIGFSASMIFYGFEAAGQMIDNQRGVSLARILIPELGEQSSISGAFLFQFAIVLFLSLGGHRFFLESFAHSYEVLPLLSFPESAAGLLPLLDLFMKMTGQVLFISVQIAAPVIIAILIADIILGVANRVAPQINVWELGFNVKGYLGILMLFLTFAVMGRVMETEFARARRYVRQSIDLLQSKIPEAAIPW